MTTEQQANAIEQVVISGDLSKLTAPQRVMYYNQVCESLGLNPYTKPFDYISLNGKLTLYARKDAADQLRRLHGVSIGKPDIQYVDDWVVVTISAVDKTGRTDSDVGAVSRKDMRGDFGNVLMKAVTKAKRRVTLSLCGLGMLDETEVETIPSARAVSVDAETGEIVHPQLPPPRNDKPVQYEETGEVLFTREPEPKPDDEDKCAELHEIISKMHHAGKRPASEKAYGYLVSLVDGLTEDGAHGPILSFLCDADISSDNPPSSIAVSALLDKLAPGGEKYSETVAECIKSIAAEMVE